VTAPWRDKSLPAGRQAHTPTMRHHLLHLTHNQSFGSARGSASVPLSPRMRAPPPHRTAKPLVWSRALHITRAGHRPLRVVHGFADLHKFRQGEIMVVNNTTPDFVLAPCTRLRLSSPMKASSLPMFPCLAGARGAERYWY